jgi:hypothetical protein
MRIMLLAAALPAVLVEPVLAEEASASSALAITVRPSRIEPGTDEAREREERLHRRMQRNEFHFRNICTGCGGGMPQPGANAPFSPIEALANRPAPSRPDPKQAIEAPEPPYAE